MKKSQKEKNKEMGQGLNATRVKVAKVKESYPKKVIDLSKEKDVTASDLNMAF